MSDALTPADLDRLEDTSRGLVRHWEETGEAEWAATTIQTLIARIRELEASNGELRQCLYHETKKARDHD